MSRRWFADLPSSVPEIAAHVGAAVAIAGGGLLLGAWVATQYAAYRLGFHPALGAPLLAVTAPRRGLLDSTLAIAAALGTVGLTTRGWRVPGGVLVGLTALVLMLESWPLYAPLDFFVWSWRFGSHPDIADVWKTGTWIIIVATPVPMVVMATVDLVRGRWLNGSADAPSPARWASRRDVRSANLIGRDAGVVLGAWSARRRRRSLRHDGPEHVLAFAPTRSGKGVGLVHPNLLTWPGSTVVLDVKGEHSVLANCRVRLAYAPDTVETAAFIADMAVKMTVPKDPRRLSSPTVLDVMASEPKIPRPLLTPDDVLHLPADDALVFVTGCPPIYGKKIRPSLDPAKIPPAESDRLVHDWSSWTARVAPPVPETPAVPSEPAVITPPPDPVPPPDDDPALPIPPDEAF